MTSTTQKKFLVFFLIPTATMVEWSKTDPVTRAASEREMMERWSKWTAAHVQMILNTDVGGKTKNVTSSGIADTRNDIVLYSTVEGESHDAVAQIFLDHPHLTIPNSSIQIMETRPM